MQFTPYLSLFIVLSSLLLVLCPESSVVQFLVLISIIQSFVANIKLFFDLTPQLFILIPEFLFLSLSSLKKNISEFSALSSSSLVKRLFSQQPLFLNSQSLYLSLYKFVLCPYSLFFRHQFSAWLIVLSSPKIIVFRSQSLVLSLSFLRPSF